MSPDDQALLMADMTNPACAINSPECTPAPGMVIRADHGTLGPWCNTHYRRWQRHGDAEWVPREYPDRCAINSPECTEGRKVLARGLCSTHWQRWRIHGDPLMSPGQLTPARDWIDAYVAVPPDTDECIIWPFARNKAGYAFAENPRRNHMEGAYRIIWERVNGRPWPEDKPVARHSCNNGAGGCVNLQHIIPGTTAENNHDMVLAGTSVKGERNGNAVLTERDVLEIRCLWVTGGWTQFELGDMYGVGQTSISHIVLRKKWDWLYGGELYGEKVAA